MERGIGKERRMGMMGDGEEVKWEDRVKGTKRILLKAKLQLEQEKKSQRNGY